MSTNNEVDLWQIIPIAPLAARDFDHMRDAADREFRPPGSGRNECTLRAGLQAECFGQNTSQSPLLTVSEAATKQVTKRSAANKNVGELYDLV